jgi:hypothetical protein
MSFHLNFVDFKDVNENIHFQLSLRQEERP